MKLSTLVVLTLSGIFAVSAVQAKPVYQNAADEQQTMQIPNQDNNVGGMPQNPSQPNADSDTSSDDGATKDDQQDSNDDY